MSASPSLGRCFASARGWESRLCCRGSCEVFFRSLACLESESIFLSQERHLLLRGEQAAWLETEAGQFSAQVGEGKKAELEAPRNGQRFAALSAGMPSVCLLVILLLSLIISLISGETEVKFTGQTEFVVNETTTTVIRLVIERIGDPVNVTAIVSKPLQGVNLGLSRAVTVTILSNDNAFGIISFDMPALITLTEPRGENESVPFTLVREKGTYGSVTVFYEVQGGPNSPEEDLSPVKGNITFTPATAVLIYNLFVLDDQVSENDEIYIIHLRSVEGGAEINSSRNSVEIIIKANDSPVRFTQSIYMVDEEDDIIAIMVVRGKNDGGNRIGPDENQVSICYIIVTGNSTLHAQLNLDFLDLQPNATIVFPPLVHESYIKFKILDDAIPEIAETFHIMLLKDTLQGDAILKNPSIVQVTIKPNDKPYGVLSINSILFTQTVVINEDQMLSTDSSPVTTDLTPHSGVLHFAQGQLLASLHLNIIDDDVPEEAEPYLLQILDHTIQGGAEVSDPAELLFYIQDSDDVYGVIQFCHLENQRIESSPDGRFLSLSFARQRGTVGDVKLFYIIMYLPSGPVDPERAKEGVLNTSRRSILYFPEGKPNDTIKIPIRNDAFLQNGAHFLIQLEKVELLNIIPQIPSISPRLGEIKNVSLRITPDIANGEIGFISNLSIILPEPEDSLFAVSSIPLHRDGTDGQATVFWSLTPTGLNSKAVTIDDIWPFSGSVLFLSGQSDTALNITIQADDIPEMNETLTLSLDSVNVENQILKSGYTSRKLIIPENDDPGGVFEFASSSRGPYKIKEGESVELQIVRSRGALMEQFLLYTIEPRDSNEFYGNTGVLQFKPGEREIKITLLTRMDEIPELDEFYSVLLSSHGDLPSKLGNATRVNITILKNNDPHGIIQFVDNMMTVTINESKGEDFYAAVFKIVRNQGTFGSVSVSWATDSISTKDIFPDRGTIFFGNEEFSKDITIYSVPDEIPEEMEVFIISLFNTTGGASLGNITTATLQITKNDCPIYFADPAILKVHEGGIAEFVVVRNDSGADVVSVLYATIDGNASAEDFMSYEKNGVLWFDIGIKEQNITIFIHDDDIPESDEDFYIILFNSTGDTVIYKPRMATVIIEANDDPNGIFLLESTGKAVEEGKMNDFLILRHRGYFGNVSLAWQLFGNNSALDPGQEFYEVSGTIWFIEGEQSQPIILHAIPDKIPEFGEFYTLKLVNASGGIPGGQLSETNLSVTVMIPMNDDPYGVFILDPQSQDREVAEDIQSEDDTSCITSFTVWRHQGTFGTVRIGWEILSSTFREGLPVMIDFLLLGKFTDSVKSKPHMRRHHTGTDALYFSGEEDAYGIIEPEVHVSKNRPGIMKVGAGINGSSRYKGMMQDVRFYECKLTKEEISELHAMPARSDLYPISGYLEYRQGERNKSFIVSAKDDKEEEGEELFILKLISVYGGAQISQENTTATLRIQKSDNANGLFGFTGACIPEVSNEGSTVSCVVERTRGALDSVFVYYTISQIDSYGINYTVTDFANRSGIVTFLPFQRSEVLNLHVLDDDIPELKEYFQVTLVSAVTGDGKTGSTPTSGASIDPEKETTYITVKASDHPYGLLQFSVGQPPSDTDEIILSATTAPHITVKEEVGQVSLLVVRAQGLLGTTVAQYRTVALTAISPQDYQLEKTFKVELLNPDGAVSEFFNGGSGSGDGDFYFLPRVHQYAGNLGIGSHIIVTIEASDDAHGVFEFDAESLSLSGMEPEDGRGIITFEIIRYHGALSQVILYWFIVPNDTEDVTATSGNITFHIEQRKANLTVNILPDEIPELDRTLSVYIINVTHGRLGIHTNATLTILANDDPYGLLIFSGKNRPIKVEEETKNVTLTIVRLKGHLGVVKVSYRTMYDEDVSLYLPSNIARATLGEDYLPISGFVILPANESEATLHLPILDDDEPEQSESVFVELLGATLIGEVNHQPISDSPRLGSTTDTIAHIIINANDDAFGTLQLSAPAVQIPENYIGPIINVTRTGGIFADVSVKFRAVPITATAGEDYSVASSDVVLLEGETSKAVPIYIINDINPEREESFFVQLLNQTTGGAQLGSLTQAVITIEASDDPFGSFVFQTTNIVVKEPEANAALIDLPVIRNAGTLSNVTVEWIATIDGQFAASDLKVFLGNIQFSPGETMKNLVLEILNDDVPEIEEIIIVELTQASNGGTIGLERVANVVIPANDKPYGTVSFQQNLYRIEEPLERSSTANITVKRSGGRFGQLKIFYSTSDIDFITLAQEQGLDVLCYYEAPIQGIPDESHVTRVNLSLANDSLYTCAILCLKEQACSAFYLSGTSEIPSCFWAASWSSSITNISGFWIYKKNLTTLNAIFSTQAIANNDYEPVTSQWMIMEEGEEFANLTVSILPDDFPELDEKFAISLLQIMLMNITASIENQPVIGQPNTTTVLILMNGDAFGVFVIYSISPHTTENGLYVEVQEQPQNTVQLMIHRTEGSLGQVMVEWSISGGTATPNLDFISDGEVLIFAKGETKKPVTLTILDDTEPEDDESIRITLTHTEGGSRILPSSDTVTVVILANDNVAGILSFQTSSRSVIAHEGELLQFHVLRTAPGAGNVTVDWEIVGHNLEQNFENISGTLCFLEIPEEKKEYHIILYNIKTQGVTSTGIAILDHQGYEAVLTVEASDEPYGILNFASSSRTVLVQEENKTIQLFINREFGSLGVVNVTYTTISEFLGLKNQTEGAYAEPGADYIPISGSIILKEGVTTATINITILEDDIPEMQEYFFINLTSVKLVTYPLTSFPPRLDMDGLTAQIIIDANDGARGVVSWQNTRFEISELNINLTLVIFRDRGLYGNVSLFLYAQNLEAYQGVDFNLSSRVRRNHHRKPFFHNIKWMFCFHEKSTITILANDDGHGVLSFNNSEHFFLREQTALYLMESVAILNIIREPPQGIFGTVTVQYIVREINSSEASVDLTPSQGYIVLEEGIRVKEFSIENPHHCISFQINGSTYLVITHGGIKEDTPSNNTVFLFTSGFQLLEVQSILVPATSDIKYFNLNQSHYLIIASCRPESKSTQWSENDFIRFQEVPINGITQVKAVLSGSDIYLIFAKELNSTCEIFVWETGQFSFRYFQSISIRAVNAIHTFFPPSGLVHVLFASKDISALYSWNSEMNQFSPLLEAPSANHISSINVKSLNSNKSLIIVTGDSYSYVYELTAISNQSDFIPSSGELIFEPGDKEIVIAINIFDDTVPEAEESFRVWLKNPKGGAEIGPNGYVTIVVPSNDDAHGVVAFAQNSLFKQAEEMEQDTLITLNVERLISTFGHVIVHWEASGSINDIFPTSGVVVFLEGQALTTVTLTVLADVIPEASETLIITLTHISTVGIQDPQRGAIIDRSRAKAILTILPNDTPLSVVGWHTDSLFNKVAEPEGRSTTIILHIFREQPFVGDISIHIISHPIFSLPLVNQAIENEDYRLENKTIIMTENITLVSVNVTILPDNIPELQEGFLINISSVQLLNSSLTRGQQSMKKFGLETAEILIEENDNPRGIFQFNISKDMNKTVAAYEIPPPDNILKLCIVRKAGTFGSIKLDWKATPASASLKDFSPSFGNLIFADGQVTGVIEITIIDDDEVEFLEMFTVTLLRVTGDARLGDDVQVMVTIAPNDSPAGVFSFEEKHVTVKEPQSVYDPTANVFLTVSRSSGGQGEVQILWKLEEAARYDLTPLNGTLFFSEMESQKTIILHAIQDDVLEGDEHYSIHLVSTGNTEISTLNGIATITILADQGASGVVGLASQSTHVLIGEPVGKYNGTAFIGLVRGPGIFGEITVSWIITSPDQKEFADVSGTVTMRDQQSAAVILIQALDDDIPEEKQHYQFQLTGISNGGVIDEAAKAANITMTASDLPYGQFTFPQEVLQTTEEEKWANITVVRSHGFYKQVHLLYKTLNGTAVEGSDFGVTSGELIFKPTETVKTIYVEVYDDDLPEGPEDFSIVIMKLELLGSGFDFTIKENGLQIDQPPEIGNASIMRIIISKSDSAEGIIEFDPSYASLEVEEDVGWIMIPVFRKLGNYGFVTADFISRSISALPDGIDYSIANNSVIFHHGQIQSFISILIINDEESENAEQFEIQLIGASGGAVLGLYLVTQITIAKSDSPHGIVRFLNESQIILPNPNVSLTLSLVLERTGELIGESQINWDILGPNSEVILPPLNSDIRDPVNGSFYFAEAEGGLRQIDLKIYPHEEVEVQEIFIIRLHVMRGETELDPKAANITVKILKFGDPNGIVQFVPESLSPKIFEEPSASEGPLNIVLSIKRIQGIMGNITIYWKLSSNSDTTNDFIAMKGSVVIPDLQRTSDIVISLLPDDVPEIDEHYEVHLTSVEGGADLDLRKSISRFMVVANDDPYGVFALYGEKQSVQVEKDLSRHIQINISRHAGTFADVIVEYQISSYNEEKVITPANRVGNLHIKAGSSYGLKTVPIYTQVFISLGMNLTLELINVMLVNISANIAPKILETARLVSFPIPKEAANSQVAFDSIILRLMNITAGTTEALVTRKGIYGSIVVTWNSGYPSGLIPLYLHQGSIIPASGTVSFSHGEQNKTILLQVIPNANSPEVFAVHLAAVQTNASGGACLRSNFIIAEIEPMGVFQFSPSSRNILVSEDVQTVKLNVQRLFGYQSNLTKVLYQTTAGSAKSLEDFEPAHDGELVFGFLDINTVLEILVTDDSISEGEEMFFVNLTSVNVLDVQDLNPDWNPRLNPEFSIASVTLLASDIHYGILSLGPTIIYTEEDSNNIASNTILIHIRRTQGFVGNISVNIKTFGAINAQSGADIFPFEIVPVVSNLTWAIEGTDFEEMALSVTLLDGERESEVSVTILDDDEPEGEEFFYVVLSEPQDGAQITESIDEYGFKGFTTIIIKGRHIYVVLVYRQNTDRKESFL
ncbi:G-protein coupled receptor 98, partial [Ophiophagus hannah]